MNSGSMDAGVVEPVDRTCVIELDAAIYPEDAVIRASHRLSGRCAPAVERAEDKFVVRLQMLDNATDPEAIGREFLVVALDEG